MAVVVNPPNGHGNDNPIQVKVEYDKSITPGTGVANFVFCVEKLGRPECRHRARSGLQRHRRDGAAVPVHRRAAA